MIRKIKEKLRKVKKVTWPSYFLTMLGMLGTKPGIDKKKPREENLQFLQCFLIKLFLMGRGEDNLSRQHVEKKKKEAN